MKHPHPDLVERLLIPLQTGDLLLKIIVTDSPWEVKNRILTAPDEAFIAGLPSPDTAQVPFLRALLLYLHDCLPEARGQIRDLESSAMRDYIIHMTHRRGGDFELARKALDRIYFHPCYTTIHTRAGARYDLYARQPNWDPYLFLGQCEQYKYGDTDLEPQLRDVQKIEWTELFEHCWSKCAAGHAKGKEGEGEQRKP